MRLFFLLYLFIACQAAYAQFTDDFTDGDFTSAPAWNGSNSGADFTISAGRLKSNDLTANSNFYLSTASTLANNCQWEFWCNLQFNTSSANYVDVYLVSDQSNLQSAAINGYFVRIGNTLDEICLYKRTGATSTSVKIIDGIDGVLNTSNNVMKIKVIRTAGNLFTLERDLSGTGNSYITEGSVIDNSIVVSSGFGVFIQQSSSGFFQKHFFDTFYAGPIITDTVAPTLSTVNVISSTQLDVLFSEIVDTISCQANSNYPANNGLNFPQTAKRDSANRALVHLSFSTAFTSGLQNTITINGVKDTSGNAMSSATSTFTYYGIGTGGYKDVIINEFMADPNPTVGQPSVEYLEIYNRGTQYYNLNGWKITDNTTTGTITSNYLLAPNSYVLITASIDTGLFTSISNKIGVGSFPSLNDAGDNVFLKNNAGVFIDSVHYFNTWYNNSVKKNGGWSLELINPDPNVACPASNNWTATNDSSDGTPGLQNSVYSTSADTIAPQSISAIAIDSMHILICFNEAIDITEIANISNYTINHGIGIPTQASSSAGNTCVTLTLATPLASLTNYIISYAMLGDCSGNIVSPNNSSLNYIQIQQASYKDIIINEIFADPSPAIALPTDEFVELYNKSSKYINLQGLKFTDNSSTATLPNYILAPGEYIILLSTIDTTAYSVYSNKIRLSNFPSLNDAGDHLYLKTAANNYIDSVNYSSAWYNDPNKNGGGWTLELINPNPNAACPIANNWTASNDTTGGTPGIQNSVYSTLPDNTAPQATGVTVIDSVHISVCFNEAIDATKITNTSSYTLNNSIGTPVLAIDSSTTKCVTLTLATPLISLTNYIVSFSTLSDCSGNLVSPSTISFNYIHVEHASYKDILINEIFADPLPAVGLPIGEFVELYNKSTKYINLQGLKLTDSSSTATLPNYIFAPNTYIILLSNADTAAFSAYQNKIGLSNFPSLNDAADHLYLKTAGNYFIDSVSYSSSWYKDPVKKNGGWSLELINPNPTTTCMVANNWIASKDTIGGTPGIQNSVYSTVPDTTAPYPLSSIAIDSIHILVSFNEAIDAAKITNTNNYLINNGIGTPISAIDSSNSDLVKLTLATPLISLTNYTISFPALSDCSGNSVSPTAISLNYIRVEQAAYKDIIINELFADPFPTVGLPGAEYVELYNKSPKYINLQGLKFTDSSSTALLPNYILAPNTYVVLLGNADTASFTAYPNKIGLTNFPSLNDAGDHLYLKAPTNYFIDSVTYSSTWYNDPNKKNGGWSLELINPNPNTACPSAINWIASNDSVGGTPGLQNSVFSLGPDTISPQALSVTIIDSTHISVCFNERINNALLSTTGNYTINNNIGNPFAASVSANGLCVGFTLSNALSNQTNYTLSFTSLNDCSGNAIHPSFINFAFYVPKPNDVVINEIMCDPDPPIALPDYEYIELYNKTVHAITIKNWSISTPTVTKTIPDIVIAADSFVVLTGTSGFTAYSGLSLPVYLMSGFPSLANTGSTLILRNEYGTLINTVSYNDTWYRDAAKAEGGFSLELIDPNNPCAGDNNWRASDNIKGGTPGNKNSVYAINPDNIAPQLNRISVIAADSIQLYFNESMDSLSLVQNIDYTIDNNIGHPLAVIPVGPDFKTVKLKLPGNLLAKLIYSCTVTNIHDCVNNSIGTQNNSPFAIPEPALWQDLVINEIMFEPKDNGKEWIEIYNRSDKTIDLADVLIGKYDTMQNIVLGAKQITQQGYLIFPGEYIVISASGAMIKSQYYTANPAGFIDASNFPSLGTTDVSSISDLNGNAIDYVKYSSKMHFSLLNDTKGVSLERIDFNRPSNDRTNWNSASVQVGFATPAYRNSQYLQADGSSTVGTSPEIFSPDNDGYNDVVNITYEFAEAGKAGNISIYDSRGHFIKYLVKNESLGTKGTYSWNGITQENEKAPIGIYIIYFETFDSKGKVEKYKLTTVLAGKL